MHTNELKNKKGCPIKSPDGRKRKQFGASVSAVTMDQIEAWLQLRQEAHLDARLGDLFDKLVEFGRVNGFDASK